MEKTGKSFREIIGPRADARTGSSDVGQCTVEHHATKRMESIYKQCIALQGLFPGATDLELTFKGAEMQGRKASNGFHACHFNPFSNLQTKLKKRVVIKVLQKALTPGTENCLKVFGLDSPGLKEVNSGRTEENIDEVLSKYNIVDILDPKTRELAVTLCGTDSLPEYVNHTDSNMEMHVKPKSIKIFKKLLVGETTAKDATLKLQKNIISHFEAAVKHIKEVEAAYNKCIEVSNSLIKDQKQLVEGEQKIKECFSIIKKKKKPGLGGCTGLRLPDFKDTTSLTRHKGFWKANLDEIVLLRLQANIKQLEGTKAFVIPQEHENLTPSTSFKSLRKRNALRLSIDVKSHNMKDSESSSARKRLSFEDLNND